MNNQFINFRLVTSSSLSAGLINVSEAVEYISQNQDKYSPYIGLANRNNMMDNTSLFKYAKKNKISPISSVELDLIHIKQSTREVQEGFDKRDAIVEDKQRYAMLFIAKSFRGYQNLCKLQTILYTKSVNENKRGIVDTTFQDFPELLEDVFVLSGGLNSGQNNKQSEGAYLFKQFVNIKINEEQIRILKNEGKDFQRNLENIENAKQDILDFITYWRNVTDGNFFIELQRQGTEYENEYIDYIVPIANQLGVPVIATQNVYFLKPEDYEKHEYMLAYRGGYTRYSTNYEEKKQIHCTPENYLKTNQEMAELFSDIPVAIENTYYLAEECHFDLKPIPNGSYHMPQLKTSNGESIDDFFTNNANQGLENVMLNLFKMYIDPSSDYSHINEENKRQLFLPKNNYFNKFKEWKNLNISIEEYGVDGVLSELKKTKLYQEYQDRLNYEIGVIIKMGFASYFTVVADMVQYAKDNEIPVGLGRGSGAGSLVAYAMKITDLDPLQFDLLFERFLNPERASMPDFDIDFETDRRSELFDYLGNKYNALGIRFDKNFNEELHKYLKSPSAAKIATLSLLGTSSSLEVAGAALGKLNNNGAFTKEMKEIFAPSSKNNGEFAEDPDSMLDDGELEGNTSFYEKAISNKKFTIAMRHGKTFKEMSQIANGFFGHTRTFSSHAAGEILTPHPLDDLTPIFVDKNGAVVVQQNMKDAESLGLIKFDLLGLLTLTYIDAVRKEINISRQREGLSELSNEELMNKINVYDLNVYESIFKPADTSNVFQFESNGFMDTLRKIKPTCFEDLIAAVALFRPGPMEHIPDFAAVKHGKKQQIDYAPSTPKVKEILSETYGIPVYQEQIMQMLQACANYSTGEADIVRRAMGKKDKEEMAKQRNIFIDKMVGRFPESRADEIRQEAIKLFDEAIVPFAEYGFNKSHAAAYAKTSFITAWLKHYYPKEFYVGYLNVMYNHKKNNEIPKLVQQILKKDIAIQATTNINESGSKYSLNENGEIVLPLNLGLQNSWKAFRLIDLRNEVKANNGKGFENIQHLLNVSLQNGLTFTEKELSAMIKSGAFDIIHKNEYGSLLGNTNKLLQSAIQKNEDSVNPVYKYLPSRLLKVGMKSNSETIVLDIVRREVPLAQKLKDRFNLFGYLSDYGEVKNLREQYFDGFTLIKDRNKDENLNMRDLINNSEYTEKVVQSRVYNEIIQWRSDLSKKPNAVLFSNAKESVLTWGMVVGFKKTKEAIDLYIQLDNKTVHIISYADNFKNAKFELMTPYLFKMECSMDRDYKPEETGSIYEDSIPLTWRLIDFFSLDNSLKQIANATQNQENLPTFVFNNTNIVKEKYGKDDVETQSQEILNILYNSYALSEETIDTYENILEKDNGEKIVNYNATPTEIKLPNGNIIGVHFNDLMEKNCKSFGLWIELDFDKKMLLNNKLRNNAFVGNAVKSDSFETIQYQLNNNVEFNKVLPHLNTIDSNFFKKNPVNKQQGEYLVYGYLKHTIKDKKTGELNKLIIIDQQGQEIIIEAKFGRLNQETLKNNIKHEQPILAKVDYYFYKGNDKLNLLDFYLTGDIENHFNLNKQMVYTSIKHKDLIFELAKNNEFFVDKDIQSYGEYNIDNVQEPLLIKFDNDEIDTGIKFNLIRSNILISNKTEFLSILKEQNIVTKELFYGDVDQISAVNVKPNHEKEYSSSELAICNYEYLNEIDNPINLAYKNFPNKRGKLSSHFLTISDLKQNSEIYGQNNAKVAILGTLVRKESISDKFERLVITDGNDVIKVSYPSNANQWGIDLKDYEPNGAKYGEPLIWRMDIELGSTGVYFKPRHILTLDEAAKQLTKNIYIKGFSKYSPNENMEKFVKAIEILKARQLNDSNAKHLDLIPVTMIQNGQQFQIEHCKADSVNNLIMQLSNLLGEKVELTANLQRESYPILNSEFRIPQIKHKYSGNIVARKTIESNETQNEVKTQVKKISPK